MCIQSLVPCFTRGCAPCEAALIRRVVCYLWSSEEASVDIPCLVGVTSSGNRKQCQDACLPLVSILGKKSAQSPLNASLPRKSKIAQSLICFEYHRVLVASISQVSSLLIQTHVSSFPFKVPLGVSFLNIFHVHLQYSYLGVGGEAGDGKCMWVCVRMHV